MERHQRQQGITDPEQLTVLFKLMGLDSCYELIPQSCDLTADPVRVAVRLTEISKKCPGCGRNRTLAGTYWRTLQHGTILGDRVEIDLKVQRLHCDHCNETPGADQPGIPSKKQQSASLKKCAEIAIARRHTHAEVAREFGCSSATAARIAAARVAALDARRSLRFPHYLSVDEIGVSCGTICVIANPRARTPFELLEDYDEKTIEAFFAKLPNPEDVWVVTLDMAFHFADVVTRMLPNACVVIDPWHIKRMLIKCFRRLLGAAINQLDPTTRKELRKRENRRLLTARFGVLKRKKRTREILKILSWCAQSPMLAEGYRYLQRMYTLWNRRIDAGRAADLFRRFTYFDLSPATRRFFEKQLLKDGKRQPSFLQQIEDHWNEVFAYWDTGLTSGYVEALNHTIRDLDRAARGMSFQTLRGRVLYTESPTSEIKKKRLRKPRKYRALKGPLPQPQGRSPRGRGRHKRSTAQLNLPLPPPTRMS